MKNIIITTGALVFFVTVLSWQTYGNQALMKKQIMKSVASEAAFAAAAVFEEDGIDKAEEAAGTMAKLNLGGNSDKWTMDMELVQRDNSKWIKIRLKRGKIKASAISRIFSKGEKEDDELQSV